MLKRQLNFLIVNCKSLKIVFNFRKIGDDFKKWKENRTAEYQKELEKQEQELCRAKASKVAVVKTESVVNQFI